MADDGKPGPTATEAIFFFNIVQHMKNKGDIDWDAVAESSGFKNAGVARVRFGQIKRKYGLEGDSPTKKTGKGAQAGDVPSTPTKVTKSRKAPGGAGRGRKVKKEEPEDDEATESDCRAVKERSETPPANRIKSESAADGFALF
ncbi:hypothetical protein G3M48_002600 [Beauveria asiatica]|uniref:Myb-like DNA-binding domain-containing protein n=1 Tax=Beauveria asiatica TaxID=1069075 RepID=A0AAW0RY69_9HYPO